MDPKTAKASQKPAQSRSRTHWARRLGTVLMGTMLSAGARDDRSQKPLTPGEQGWVETVVDGDTVILDSGLQVRLSGMQAPKLPLGRPDFVAWPLADEAKSELETLCLGQVVRLNYGGLRRDRYDRALAQTYVESDTGQDLWLQEAMIRRGYGRVYTWPDTWQNSDALFAAEREARAAKRGIWANAFYDIRSPDPNALAQDMDSFQLVEGIIVSANQIRGVTYLNFGADYRTDFTIKIDKSAAKRFKGWDFKALEGARVRVRGWLEMENGPIIYLDHPERLEILD